MIMKAKRNRARARVSEKTITIMTKKSPLILHFSSKSSSSKKRCYKCHFNTSQLNASDDLVNE